MAGIPGERCDDYILLKYLVTCNVIDTELTVLELDDLIYQDATNCSGESKDWRAWTEMQIVDTCWVMNILN